MPKKAKSGGKICPEGKAWARRTFDTYPSAYANMAASKYCKNPNYAKKSKGGIRKGIYWVNSNKGGSRTGYA